MDKFDHVLIAGVPQRYWYRTCTLYIILLRSPSLVLATACLLYTRWPSNERPITCHPDCVTIANTPRPLLHLLFYSLSILILICYSCHTSRIYMSYLWYCYISRYDISRCHINYLFLSYFLLSYLWLFYFSLPICPISGLYPQFLAADYGRTIKQLIYHCLCNYYV